MVPSIEPFSHPPPILGGSIDPPPRPPVENPTSPSNTTTMGCNGLVTHRAWTGHEGEDCCRRVPGDLHGGRAADLLRDEARGVILAVDPGAREADGVAVGIEHAQDVRAAVLGLGLHCLNEGLEVLPAEVALRVRHGVLTHVAVVSLPMERRGAMRMGAGMHWKGGEPPLRESPWTGVPPGLHHQGAQPMPSRCSDTGRLFLPLPSLSAESDPLD